MTPNEFYDLLDAAEAYLQGQQETLGAEFGLDWSEQYLWDQDTGTLRLSSGDTVKLAADIQIVGSVSTRTKSWRWAWDNPEVTDRVKAAALEVKQYGQTHDIPPLTLAKWEGDESDGWNMTALTAHLLHACGAYRTPIEGGFVYMIITRAHRPE